MVKGISKQVILVKPREDALFEQAIFIVKDDAPAVTDAELLRQAREAAAGTEEKSGNRWRLLVPFLCGSFVTGVLWAISCIF